MSLLLQAYSESGQQLEYSVVSWKDAYGSIPKEAIFIRISILYSSDLQVSANPQYYLKWKGSSALYRISMWHRVLSLRHLSLTPWFSQTVKLFAPMTCQALCNSI